MASPVTDHGFAVGEALPADAQSDLERGRRALEAIVELQSPEQVAAYIRQRDDEQIMQQMLGEASTAWFYEFKIQGKPVRGVSVVGAEQFARLRAEQGFPIRFPIHNLTAREVERHGEPGIEVIAIARDYRSGAEGIGMAWYPWYPPRKDNKAVLDDKADRKALAVAKRNAILDLVPEHMVRELLERGVAAISRNGERQREDVTRARAERERTAVPAPRTSAVEMQDPYATPHGATESQRRVLHELAQSPVMGERNRTTLAEACEQADLTLERAADLIARAHAFIARRSGPARAGELELDDPDASRDAVAGGQ